MGDIGQNTNRQVKVDNWGIFFLQRLHHFYKRNYHCDLTLQFSGFDAVKSVKVHRLVLYACTDYFESLDVLNDAEHGEFLQLSKEMHPDVVIPIISFMYTGKLEFPVSLQPKLYEAATMLRMTILTKLLDVQPKPSTQAQTFVQSIHAEDTYPKVVAFQQGEGPLEYSNNFDNSQDSQDSYTPAVQVTHVPANCTIASSVKQVEEPIVTLTPVGVTPTQQKTNLKPDVICVPRTAASDKVSGKANNVVKVLKIMKNTCTAKGKVPDLGLPPTLPGRKLPVWKRRVPFTGSQSLLHSTADIREPARLALEAAKPTRFEWDEDLNDPTDIKPVEDAMKVLSHDLGTDILQPIIIEGTSPIPPRHKEPSTSSVELGKRSAGVSIPASPPDSPSSKKSKQNDLQDMKEYGKQQQLRNEILCSEENTEDTMDPDDLYGSCNDESDDLPNMSQSNVGSSIPKPILKTVARPEPSHLASKRVRFSLEGKENNDKQLEIIEDFTATKQSEQSVLTKQKIVLPMDMNQIRTGGNHAKIVSEVLKKYPNLVRHNKNIKLKIMSKGVAAVPSTVQHAVERDASTGNKISQPKVSYIYLKNESPGRFPVLQSGEPEKDHKGFDVENRTGPWFCHVCSPAPETLEFGSYYEFRKHLVEVHELKIDARICEYCGLKNSKRNHLLYHLYTKHNIEPPSHVSFPKCPACDYIALSDALLVKHKATHDMKEGLTCYLCNVVFRSFSSMQIHLQSSWHKKKALSVTQQAQYPCPFCESQFENATDLKDHIESGHQSQSITLQVITYGDVLGHMNSNYHAQQASLREGKQVYRCPYCEARFASGDILGKHIFTAHWCKKEDTTNNEEDPELCELQSGQELQYTEDSQETDRLETAENQPSSELESLNNVASGIATSLNLAGNEQTVVYYEQQTEHQDIGGEATVMTGEECREYVIPETIGDMESRGEYHQNINNDEPVNVENEDSNSRTSNTEEVMPTSCSDHDYSEPQVEENMRQMIPIQSLPGSYPGSPQLIQQILPDQRLVFSTQPNVVFQQSRIGLPQRVLLAAPGNMVLSQIGHPGQNVILSQVIPQTRIILSNPILQQSGNIIQDPNGTIVFSNPEAQEQMQNVQTLQYPIQDMATEKQDQEMVHKTIHISGEEEEEEEIEEEEEEIEGGGVLAMEGEPQEVCNVDDSMNASVEEITMNTSTEEQEQEQEQQGEAEVAATTDLGVVAEFSEASAELEEIEDVQVTDGADVEQETENNEGEQETILTETNEENEVNEETETDDREGMEEIEEAEEAGEAGEAEAAEGAEAPEVSEIPDTTEENDKNEGEVTEVADLSDNLDESASILNNKKEEARLAPRVETAKIVDDWDESNENQQNVQNLEERTDGPSRPENF